MNKQRINPYLQRIGLTPEEARRIAQKNALLIRPPDPKITPYRTNHIRTDYLDGEGQRLRTGVLEDNEAFIAGRLLIGRSVIEVAAAFMVADMTIYNRANRYGLGRKPQRQAENVLVIDV